MLNVNYLELYYFINTILRLWQTLESLIYFIVLLIFFKEILSET